MELITGLFSAFGLSASAGLNAYIPLLAVALLTRLHGSHQAQHTLGWNRERLDHCTPAGLISDRIFC
jgi:hypothetical protein